MNNTLNTLKKKEKLRNFMVFLLYPLWVLLFSKRIFNFPSDNSHIWRFKLRNLIPVRRKEERLTAEYFSRETIAITRVFQQQVVAHSFLFPRDYQDPLSRVYILPPETNSKRRRRRVSRRVLRLAYLYLSQSPSPDFSLLLRFVFLSLSLNRGRRRRQGRVRQDYMINYRLSKPRRAFICTALALSLAPLLIFLGNKRYPFCKRR